MELQANLDALGAPDTVVWAISNDDTDRLRDFVASEGIETPMIYDPDATTIKAYGVYNEASERVISHPTAVIVDREGIVRYVRVDEDYQVRPSIEELLAALAGM